MKNFPDLLRGKNDGHPQLQSAMLLHSNYNFGCRNSMKSKIRIHTSLRRNESVFLYTILLHYCHISTEMLSFSSQSFTLFLDDLSVLFA